MVQFSVLQSGRTVTSSSLLCLACICHICSEGDSQRVAGYHLIRCAPMSKAREGCHECLTLSMVLSRVSAFSQPSWLSDLPQEREPSFELRQMKSYWTSVYFRACVCRTLLPEYYIFSILALIEDHKLQRNLVRPDFRH